MPGAVVLPNRLGPPGADVEPASGSVSTMVAPQRLSISSRPMFCCSGVPRSWMMLAKAGPQLYIQIAGFAPSTSSAIDQTTDRGARVPP